MTSAIESDRFNAKCDLGKTYEIIEIAKEINEPSTHYEQICTTIQKTYFLSTGESVNKLSDKHYLIIKNQKIISRKKLLLKIGSTADIKTIFDYLKNQALCIAIVLAIPEIIKITTKTYQNPILIVIPILFAASASLVFTLYNLIWLFTNLESKPKFNFLNIFTVSFVVAAIATAMWLALLKIYNDIDFNTLPSLL